MLYWCHNQIKHVLAVLMPYSKYLLAILLPHPNYGWIMVFLVCHLAKIMITTIGIGPGRLLFSFVEKIYQIRITICIPITFNNPLKVCFLNKKYTITIQTRPKQIVKVYFLLRNRFLTNFLRLFVYENCYLSLFVQI